MPIAHSPHSFGRTLMRNRNTGAAENVPPRTPNPRESKSLLRQLSAQEKEKALSYAERVSAKKVSVSGRRRQRRPPPA